MAKSTKVNSFLVGKFWVQVDEYESDFWKERRRIQAVDQQGERERKWLIIRFTKLKANLKVSLKFRFHKWIHSVMDGNTFCRVSIGCRKLETCRRLHIMRCIGLVLRDSVICVMTCSMNGSLEPRLKTPRGIHRGAGLCHRLCEQNRGSSVDHQSRWSSWRLVNGRLDFVGYWPDVL